MKADLFFRWSGRSDQLFYGREDFGELLVIFLFQRFDLSGQVAVGVHESAQLDERAHDSDVDFHSAPGAQGTRQHGNALLGKRVRAVACAAMLA